MIVAKFLVVVLVVEDQVLVVVRQQRPGSILGLVIGQAPIGKVYLSFPHVVLWFVFIAIAASATVPGSKSFVLREEIVWPECNFDFVLPEIDEMERAVDSLPRVVWIEGNDQTGQRERGVVVGDPFGQPDRVLQVDEAGRHSFSLNRSCCTCCCCCCCCTCRWIIVVEKFNLEVPVIHFRCVRPIQIQIRFRIRIRSVCLRIRIRVRVRVRVRERVSSRQMFFRHLGGSL
mmetsp:Transcript_2196/g.4439  ORF Transcript_2196/g.4439 Transcript_2196/m.4439 type:complete len:230 (+) Transcript_2196:1020-1709(+)